ncbi:actin-related protein 8 [Petromyzon marinus]|uniref:Actin-related protein 8 n=1 Tax=Petromyzon marinus TaxID=7757 RepID=A0AAJ7TWR8_PETMA|nr:actin-related protein 8 isoform X1 [Petromyzon marinus]
MTPIEKDKENGKENDREKDKEKDKEKEQRGAKRPIVPATIPESVPEQIRTNFIVVMHPGSTTLRLGRASSMLPISLPHCIARRHKSAGQPCYEDPWLLRDGLDRQESKEQRQHGLKMVEQAIWSRKMSNGARRIPTQPDQLAGYNSRVKPVALESSSSTRWTNVSHKPEFLIGDEALHVNKAEGYNLHWPMRRGRLNIHGGPGGSLSAVLADLEAIWMQAIHRYLDISSSDVKYYRCILLIPDIYNRQHVKELMNMLLTGMGFAGAMVHQESVCASFGCGLSCACVVDIGDQKTSICCVEDGISHRHTRLFLEYGGSDVTRCFYLLMQRSGFPYRECQLANRMNALLLQQLKENFCHLDQDISGFQDHEFQVRQPDSVALLYQFKLGDEKLQAPMSMFYPAVFGIVGQRMTLTQQRSQGDPEDPYDEHYLLATQSKQEQAAKAVAERKALAKHSAADSEGAGAPAEASEGAGRAPDGDQGPSRGVGETHHLNQPGAPSLLSRKLKLASPHFEGKALGLDKAVLHSIDCCSSEETKRKMYSSILVVGGGLLFPGAQEFLQHRIINKMPPSFRRLVETVEVITRPKDTDPRLTAWKGGVVLACLDTAQELWIHRREWERFGVRMLRERAPFVW